MTALDELFRSGRLTLPPLRALLDLQMALLEAIPYSQRLLVYMVYLALSGLYVYKQSHRPFGKARLLPVLPLIVLNLLCPLFFHPDRDLCTNVVSSLITSWMSTFKILGWALNRGPLVWPLNAIQFVAVYAFPITPTHVRGVDEGKAESWAAPSTAQQKASGPENGGATGKAQAATSGPPPAVPAGSAAAKEEDTQARSRSRDEERFFRQGGRLAESGGGHWENLRNFSLKLITAAATVSILGGFDCPPLLASFLYGLGLYCFLGMLMDGPAALATSAIGLTIAPHFDHPYSEPISSADFWNKRWNLTAGNLLRFLVYDPINEGRLVHDPKVSVPRSPWRRMLGIFGTFFVSGVMHEIMFLHFAHGLSWTFMTYFVLQGPLVLGETMVRRELRRRGIRTYKWLDVILTVSTQVWLSHLFFFGGDMARLQVPARFARNMAQSLSGSIAPLLLKISKNMPGAWGWAGTEGHEL